MPEANRTVTLIVNPAAGRASLFRSQASAIEAVLEAHGLAALIRYTDASPGSATELARNASRDSSLVIACGGDGTVHGVLQALVHTDTVLGVLPLGTANALASNLRLPLDPLAAIQQLLRYQPVRVPVGKIDASSSGRYFVVMAGCGRATIQIAVWAR